MKEKFKVDGKMGSQGHSFTIYIEEKSSIRSLSCWDWDKQQKLSPPGSHGNSQPGVGITRMCEPVTHLVVCGVLVLKTTIYREWSISCSWREE